MNTRYKKKTSSVLLPDNNIIQTETIQPSTSGFTNTRKLSSSNYENKEKSFNNQSGDLAIIRNEDLCNSNSNAFKNLDELSPITLPFNSFNKTDEVTSQKTTLHQIKSSSPVIIDHRLSLSSMSSLNSGLKPKSNNLNMIISELEKEYNKKSNPLNQIIHINTNTEFLIDNEKKIEKSQHDYSSSNSSTLSDNSLSNKDMLQINSANTIASRYKNFERQINSSTSSNINSDQNKLMIKNNSVDFGSRIDKLKFIDDSAPSTTLASPAESMNRFHFGRHPQQHQHRFLNSNNYKKPVADSNLESNSTNTSRTVSLSVSAISSSCCSTPMGSIDKNQNMPESIKSLTEGNNKTSTSTNSCLSSLNNKLKNLQLHNQHIEFFNSNGSIFISKVIIDRL